MDFKNIKNKLNKKVHSAWVWVLAVVMGLFSFISYNVLFEPSFMPAPVIDISKKVVGAILGDQDIDVVDNNDNISNNQKNVSQNDSNQKNSVDTSDWKTYENKELGFSVKYPSDWMKREDNMVFIDIKDKDIEGEIGSISIAKYTDDNKINIDEWIDRNKNIFIGDQNINEVEGFLDRKEFTINGNVARQFTTESMGEVRDTVIQNGSNFYVIEGSNLSIIDSDSSFLSAYNGFVNSINFI